MTKKQREKTAEEIFGHLNPIWLTGIYDDPGVQFPLPTQLIRINRKVYLVAYIEKVQDPRRGAKFNLYGIENTDDNFKELQKIYKTSKK